MDHDTDNAAAFAALQDLMLGSAAELIGIIMERARDGEDRLFEVNGSLKIIVDAAMELEQMKAGSAEDGTRFEADEFLARLRERTHAH